MSILIDIISAPYNAVTGKETSWQVNEDIATGQDEITGVATSADEYYGDGSAASIAAWNAVHNNIGQVASDHTNIENQHAQSDCQGINLLGCCIDSYESFLTCGNTAVKIGLAALAALTGIYLFVTFGPLIGNLLGRLSSKK